VAFPALASLYRQAPGVPVVEVRSLQMTVECFSQEMLAIGASDGSSLRHGVAH
jgi:hypothetical protein